MFTCLIMDLVFGTNFCMQILERIPRVNVNVLLYLTSFLRSAIENGMDTNSLSKYCYYVLT